MSTYFDHNASTPLHPEVLEEMMPFLTKSYGNASSLHKSGRFLRSAIETARQQVATLVNSSPRYVIFTGCGTEANNLAIKGFLPMHANTTIATSPMEHGSVLEPVEQVKKMGCQIQYLPTTDLGEVDVEAAKPHLQASVDMVSVQLANNETGVIQPVEDISRYVHSKSACLVHTDATQAIAKIEVDMQQLNVDLLTLSGHKFQAPQGVGALVINSSSTVKMPLLSGGPQENHNRAGTESVALLVGLGKAAEIAARKLSEKQTYLLELRRYFEQQLQNIPNVVIFGKEANRLPNTTFFSIPYYHGETLLMQLDKAGFELASGSACHSEVTKPSHVLMAMEIDEDLALNAVRVSFGMGNTRQQIDLLLEQINKLINQLPAVMRPV